VISLGESLSWVLPDAMRRTTALPRVNWPNSIFAPFPEPARGIVAGRAKRSDDEGGKDLESRFHVLLRLKGCGRESGGVD
jgi:hypothetical protein